MARQKCLHGWRAEFSNVQGQIALDSQSLSVPPQAKCGLKGVQSLLTYKVKPVANAAGQRGEGLLAHPPSS